MRDARRALPPPLCSEQRRRPAPWAHLAPRSCLLKQVLREEIVRCLTMQHERLKTNGGGGSDTAASGDHPAGEGREGGDAWAGALVVWGGGRDGVDHAAWEGSSAASAASDDGEDDGPGGGGGGRRLAAVAALDDGLDAALYARGR